jgi:nicotinamidase-related amidase
MTAALLLIDRQNDGFPGGTMARAGSVYAAPSAVVLPAAPRDRQLPVDHVQHVSTRTGATFFLPGTRGVAIHHGVAPRSGETVVQNPVPNGFRVARLLLHLREQTSRTSGLPA